MCSMEWTFSRFGSISIANYIRKRFVCLWLNAFSRIEFLYETNRSVYSTDTAKSGHSELKGNTFNTESWNDKELDNVIEAVVVHCGIIKQVTSQQKYIFLNTVFTVNFELQQYVSYLFICLLQLNIYSEYSE